MGLSGGVDSGVSAALLKERGYDVTGVFIKIWQPEFIECTWREDRLDAMRVAAALGIPFREIDLSEEYKREVVEPMIADYARGITPNPDVLCNKSIKFGHFARWAFGEGADMVATGHYARVGSASCLLRGTDTNKDQSYFLHRITHDVLARTMFPIGDVMKADVRKLAVRFGLPVATKPDSQGLCFVGDVTMKEFLRRYISIESGQVIDMHDRIVGTHDGAALYTRGQRHGFRVQGGVHYVVDVDTANNIIRVSPDHADVLVSSVVLGDTHWINGVTPPHEVSVQTRYRENPIRARLSDEGSVVRVTFSESHSATHGQSLVVYDNDVCMGGGVIIKSCYNSTHE